MISSRFFLVWISVSLIAVVSYFPVEYLNAFKDERILLLTAHPDDECMFFAPTIQALTLDRVTRSHVHSMCLSTGDANGLGDIRKEELGRSLDVLGVHPTNRALVDHPKLKDNITLKWDPSLISEILLPYINQNHITTILTFDDGGVSGHPNHRALPEGVKHLLARNLSVPPPKLFLLKTHPTAKKYTGFLSAVYAKTRSPSRIYSHFQPRLKQSGQILRLDNDVTFVVIAGVSEYLTALRAMRQHWSQLVWFRWLYVLFSRYMWVNEWVEVPVNN